MMIKGKTTLSNTKEPGCMTLPDTTRFLRDYLSAMVNFLEIEIPV